ncbi:MAG: glycoside hydrolase family 13 protein [Clostridiales bacterium]|nr:glycoside hydrolase family 13 protein [Clostridiales bacterium]
MYNPLIHKKPYGASFMDEPTTITFPLSESFSAGEVSLFLRKEDKQIRIAPVERTKKDGEDIFVFKFHAPEWGIWHYRFEAETPFGTKYFGQSADGTAICGEWLPEWQLTVAKFDYITPEWAKGGIIYHVFADRFCKAGERPFDKSGTLHKDWYEDPVVVNPGEEYKADDYFGGNIKGIISKLDYLKSLGVTILYLSPIFESWSNHRYDTADYFKIDSLFGDEEEFKELLAECKNKGISVMLDGVFNHTGSDSIYFNKNGRYDSLGAYQSKESPYYDWYYFYDFPESYHCWWGCTVVPTVNKSNPSYRKMILGEGGVIEKWTKMGVKGWRLDVVDELPVDFMDELRKAVKRADPECLIIGEVWEDASTKISYDRWRPYFMGEQLDGVTNYPFKEAIINYAITGNALEFKRKVGSILQNYPKQSLDVLLNMLSSHDTVRIINSLSEYPIDGTSKKERAGIKIQGSFLERAKRRLYLAAALQYTLPGIPCLYYGDEAGLTGYEDPINRRTYPWGREDKELIEFFKKLGGIRHELKEEMLGETVFLNEGGLLAFERVNKDKKIRVYVNNSKATYSVPLDGKYLDMWEGAEMDSQVSLTPYSFKILKKIQN